MLAALSAGHRQTLSNSSGMSSRENTAISVTMFVWLGNAWHPSVQTMPFTWPQFALALAMRKHVSSKWNIFTSPARSIPRSGPHLFSCVRSIELNNNFSWTTSSCLFCSVTPWTWTHQTHTMSSAKSHSAYLHPIFFPEAHRVRTSAPYPRKARHVRRTLCAP